MAKSKFEKNGGYYIDGIAYMDCKVTGEPVANVSTEAASVIGSRAVMGMVGMPDEPKQKQPTGLKPTKVKAPKKKAKRRSKEEILIARAADKKKALKKAVEKQKDFINHKFGG